MCRILNVITEKKYFLLPKKGDSQFHGATVEGELGRGCRYVA